MAPAWLDKLAAASVEAALTGLLDLDPGSRAEARLLAGKRLALILEPGPVSMTLCFRDEGISVDATAMEEADASLRLDPAAAARIASEGAAAMGAGGVTIRGDTALAGAVFELLRGMRPDLLAPIGRWFGPESAHVLGESGRRAGAGLRAGIERSVEATRERLTRDGGLLPGRIEMARFLDEVDDLALATDRFEARLQALRQHLSGRWADRSADAGPDGRDEAAGAPAESTQP